LSQNGVVQVRTWARARCEMPPKWLNFSRKWPCAQMCAESPRKCLQNGAREGAKKSKFSGLKVRDFSRFFRVILSHFSDFSYKIVRVFWGQFLCIFWVLKKLKEKIKENQIKINKIK
jgi:hypothetical protein